MVKNSGNTTDLVFVTVDWFVFSRTLLTQNPMVCTRLCGVGVGMDKDGAVAKNYKQVQENVRGDTCIRCSAVMVSQH